MKKRFPSNRQTICFSAQLVISNNKIKKNSDNNKSSKSSKYKNDTDQNTAVDEFKETELNNNSISCSQKQPVVNNSECKISDLDSLIQNQYDILSMAVQNIMAVSSENICVNNKSDNKVNKEPKYFSTDNVSLKNKSQDFPSIIEDLEFKEVLSRFSEESLSMSAENILGSSLKGFSTLPRKKLKSYKSLYTFPAIDEGRYSVFNFICCLS